MKIGVLLVGVSYSIDDNHHAWRNYEHCIDNILGGINFLKNNEHKVTTYLCTYNSKKIFDILEEYDAKKSLILPKGDKYHERRQEFYINGGNDRYMVSTYYESLKLLEEEDLDFVIITRFDIWFKQNVFKRLDFTKFNFLFRHLGLWENVDMPEVSLDKTWHFTSDCMHAFPMHMKNSFKDSIYEMLGYNTGNDKHNFRTSNGTLHNIYDFLTKRISPDDINFCFNEHYHNVGNDVFNLLREHKAGRDNHDIKFLNLKGKLSKEYLEYNRLTNDIWF